MSRQSPLTRRLIAEGCEPRPAKARPIAFIVAAIIYGLVILALTYGVIAYVEVALGGAP